MTQVKRRAFSSVGGNLNLRPLTTPQTLAFLFGNSPVLEQVCYLFVFLPKLDNGCIRKEKGDVARQVANVKLVGSQFCIVFCVQPLTRGNLTQLVIRHFSLGIAILSQINNLACNMNMPHAIISAQHKGDLHRITTLQAKTATMSR